MGIKLVDISKKFKDELVLKNFSCQFNDGENYVITGPSGIGKTTLLRIIVDLQEADSGKIEKDELLRFGMVFQEDRLCESFNSIENVCFISDGLDKEEVKKALCELLDEELLDKPVNQLSGGQRRRVCVVRAMLSEGDCVVLDEPFTGMDQQTRKKTLEFILKYKKQRMIIVSAHDTKDLENFRNVNL